MEVNVVAVISCPCAGARLPTSWRVARRGVLAGVGLRCLLDMLVMMLPMGLVCPRMGVDDAVQYNSERRQRAVQARRAVQRQTRRHFTDTP